MNNSKALNHNSKLIITIFNFKKAKKKSKVKKIKEIKKNNFNTKFKKQFNKKSRSGI